MPINFGQPTESQTVAARNTSTRDALAWLGKWGEGDASITSPPVGLKRFNSGRIEEWNGSVWATKGLNADQMTGALTFNASGAGVIAAPSAGTALTINELPGTAGLRLVDSGHNYDFYRDNVSGFLHVAGSQNGFSGYRFQVTRAAALVNALEIANTGTLSVLAPSAGNTINAFTNANATTFGLYMQNQNAGASAGTYLQTVNQSGSVYALFGVDQTSANISIGGSGNPKLTIGTDSAGPFVIKTNATERIVVQTGGRVDVVTNHTTAYLNITDAAGTDRTVLGFVAGVGLRIWNKDNTDLSLGANNAAAITINGSTRAVTIAPPSSGTALTVNCAAAAGNAALFTTAAAAAVDYRFANTNGTASSLTRLVVQNGASGTATLEVSNDAGAWSLIGSPGITSCLLGTAGSTNIVINASWLRPNLDNSLSCGNNGSRWTAVWAVNGTIQTSDARDKEIEQSINADAARLFVARVAAEGVALARWKVGGNTTEQVLDGEDVVTEKYFDLVPVETTAEDGTRSTVMVEVPAEREHRTPRYRTVTTPTPGKRLHSVFLAQTVQRAYQEAGWRDFGGHVIDEEGRQHLRVDQMVPPLYVAVADLMKRVQQLETADV